VNFDIEDFLSLEGAIVVLALIVIYLLYIVLAKDAHYSKNIHSLASAMEELNRDIYYLKKKLKETQNILDSTPKRMSDEEIYQEIDRGSFDMIKPLSVAIKNLQHSVASLDENLNARISNIESGVKQISLPSSLQSSDDEKIVSLYKQGIPLEVIAKELHISSAEAEFVLKINKIK
jgi:uncharacterized protein YoxC